MQRAAVRRTAVLDPGDLALFQAQQQQHHLQQQQQAQGSQGMIAVGHPAAHAASMSMRGSFPHNAQEGHVQHPEPGFRYAGTQGTQDPYRRIAPRPPPGTVASATNGLPVSTYPAIHIGLSWLTTLLLMAPLTSSICCALPVLLRNRKSLRVAFTHVTLEIP